MKNRIFTLIELLVVVAIMAALIAMLMPALSKARETARGMLCVSNIRQCALAVNAYASDNNGFTPCAEAGSVGTTLSLARSWAVALLYFNYLPQGGVTINSGSFPITTSGVTIKTPHVLCCPSFPKQTNVGSLQAEGAYAPRWDAYGNEKWVNISGIGGTAQIGTLTTNIPYIADTVNTSTFVTAGSYWNRNVVVNNITVFLDHGRKASAAYPDGHAALRTSSDLSKEYVTAISIR